MSKLDDSSAIKLFGQTIPLQTLNQKEALADHHESSFRKAAREDRCDGNLLSSPISLGCVSSNESVRAQAPMEDQEHEDRTYNERKTGSSLKTSKNEEKSETNSSQEKTLKKPDKILPCPRCNSKETKFCYYNNYNVNQPRHFCKNCQRYWTAGGTMRNVPVGAGRRKTKSSSALHYHHHMIISEAIRAAQASAANGMLQRNPSCENSHSRVLTFGSDSSASSVTNLSEKTQIDVQSGIHKPFPWDSIQWMNTAMLPSPPSVCPPGFPVSFYPAPTYQNYRVQSPSDVVPVAFSSPSSVNQCADPSSLGKHSRNDNILKPEGRALNSKTLRIDDPGETAKSSMLATLMIKINSTNSRGLFQGFQSKPSDERNHRLETFSVLRANPAAWSRSLNFHNK
ncbi:hypothetical protein DITRI_Ditri02bG0186200 [Diplodiscus trichospermus]